MSLLCCPLHVESAESVGEALERARAAFEQGAKLIEWRADLLAEEDAAVAVTSLRALIRECPLPCIVTIRPTWEGGMYGGSETDRVSLIEAIGTSDDAPRYIDVELDAYRTSRNRRQKVNLAVDHDQQVRDVEPSLILSTHDFRGRPADLRVAAMASEPACAVMKIAWMARSLRDNLEVIDLLVERVKPTVAMCMGEFGLMSRVLAPKFGGLFTFAALERGSESAPGQPTLDEMRKLYRFDRIGAPTRVYGIVGWPVGHSRSPHFHNDAFERAGFDGVYLPLPVPAEWEHFKATVGALVDHPRLDLRGASVTIPHKAHCVRFVRERGGRVSALAAALGAANTLIVDDDGLLVCANTDAPAAVAELARALDIASGRFDGVRVAVLGAGGVARAVAGGVALAGGHAVVFNREPVRAAELAAELTAGLAALDRAQLDRCEIVESPSDSVDMGTIVAGDAAVLTTERFDAFVNCTPVGMQGGPAPDGNPLELLAGSAFTWERLRGAVVMDTVYAPEITPLLRRAREHGARCVTGLAMFTEQATRQSERWMR